MKTQKTIRNCDKEFKFICPKNWTDLKLRDSQNIRFCESCEKSVYYCLTFEETIAHAKVGNCIAREIPDDSELPVIKMGKPRSPMPQLTESQERALKWRHQEDGIDDSIKNIDAERVCSECGFPAPNWRVKCRVCGYEFGRIHPIG